MAIRGGDRSWPGTWENQDRESTSTMNDGIFLVVDGLGGHAAGEKAAETACEVIQAELANNNGDRGSRGKHSFRHCGCK